jgi:hypothetical protein
MIIADACHAVKLKVPAVLGLSLRWPVLAPAGSYATELVGTFIFLFAIAATV